MAPASPHSALSAHSQYQTDSGPSDGSDALRAGLPCKRLVRAQPCCRAAAQDHDRAAVASGGATGAPVVSSSA